MPVIHTTFMMLNVTIKSSARPLLASPPRTPPATAAKAVLFSHAPKNTRGAASGRRVASRTVAKGHTSKGHESRGHLLVVCPLDGCGNARNPDQCGACTAGLERHGTWTCSRSRPVVVSTSLNAGMPAAIPCSQQCTSRCAGGRTLIADQRHCCRFRV